MEVIDSVSYIRKCDSHEIRHYTPTSIITNFCKENIICSYQINIVTVNQHGFLKGRSTVTNFPKKFNTDFPFNKLYHGLLSKK